jgi:predicted DNA-binding transcriptional regulator AlpA
MAEAFGDAALVDAPTAASVGQVSTSQWYDEVRDGKAPQPVIRSPRFTRWRLVDVRAYWLRRAEEGSTAGAAASSMRQAVEASAKAAERRRAKAAEVGPATKPLEAPSAPPTTRWSAIMAQASGASQKAAG